MASLTVRGLDDAIKAQLRLRAAANGRSVEDEVRTILRGATAPLATATTRMNAAPPRSASRPGNHRRVTLIIGGGIAAYKALDLIRRLKERGIAVRCVLTRAAQHFVTALSASALSGERCYTDLFDADSEFDAGHIRLARDCELVLVAPATADFIAKMANGHADDLASAILLATDRPILIAPAMNPVMWANPATVRNVRQLAAQGMQIVGPESGLMAEAGESGMGRMFEPTAIAEAAEILLRPRSAGLLAGRHILVTAGPTHEAIDPVRYIANRSSGKQGFALAEAAAAAGARVTLVSGPVRLPDPDGVAVHRVESACDMLQAVEAALPADCAIFAAAVADWRVAEAGQQKIKKRTDSAPPTLQMVENPDILATIAKRKQQRPPLVIGFAAETENLIENAKAKLVRKGCDWIIANDVSPEGGVFGGDRNTIHIVTMTGVESWPAMPKGDVATALIDRVGEALRAEEPAEAAP